jgi:hypothetical protein
MSWTCYSGSNNIHFNFPPIVSDGRLFTSYQPNGILNEEIQKKENITTNWNYRQFLQNNALQIMKFNNLESCYELGLNQHTMENTSPSSNVPYIYKSTFDVGQPGYGYCNSDLKTPYLSRTELQARLIAPSINLNQFN